MAVHLAYQLFLQVLLLSVQEDTWRNCLYILHPATFPVLFSEHKTTFSLLPTLHLQVGSGKTKEYRQELRGAPIPWLRERPDQEIWSLVKFLTLQIFTKATVFNFSGRFYNSTNLCYRII